MSPVIRGGALAALLIAAAVPTGAGYAGCSAPAALTSLGPGLGRSAAKLERGPGLTILAFGSSSTQGVGASDPQDSYPARLAVELAARYPDRELRVINRGIGGQDAPEELPRLADEIAGSHPDLVIWQVGTNAVLRHDDLAADDLLIRRGVQLLKDDEADVVLMDLQYAPRVLARPSYAEMERMIGDEARRAQVGLFPRFAIMRYWDSTHQLDPAAAVGPDGLHMTDVSYRCLAADLAEALADNWHAHTLVIGAPRRPAPGAVAHAAGAPGAAGP
jgi:acyl-CoA thioesterase-1